MRRLIVLLVLLGAMLGIRALSLDAASAYALTLAAIGFVALASFTIAEMGSQLSLPRVTGYILAGITLGPYAANILSRDVVAELKMFNALALGLITTGAGLELELDQMRRMLRTLSLTTAAKIVLALILVGGGFYSIQTFFQPLALGSDEAVLAMTLIVSALALGTSPAISMAIMNELRAKGRVMDLVLGSAVFKDVIVVICLALALATGQSLLGIGTEGNVIVTVALEIAGSIVAGLILGGLLITYIRFVRAEMFFFTAAMILVVTEIGNALHLELLLVFITAGAVVRNFSKHYHELLHAVETVALPVFVVFFTTAGAGIDLPTTFQLLPIALAIAGLRGIAYFFAARWGSRTAGENTTVQKYVWLGYIPQSGVTLGLVAMAAGRLPSLGSTISAIGMAVVAINLLLGPILLRKALLLAGEVGAASPSEGQKSAVTLSSHESDDQGQSEANDVDVTGDAWREPFATLTPIWLAQSVVEVLEQTQKIVVQQQEVLQARAQAVVDLIENTPNLSTQRAELSQRQSEVFNVEEVSRSVRDAYRKIQRLLRQLPAYHQIDFAADDLRARASDPLVLKFRRFRWRWAQRLRSSSQPLKRQIPLQNLLSSRLEPVAAKVLVAQSFATLRLFALLLDEVRVQAREAREPQRVAASLRDVINRWRGQIAADQSRALIALSQEIASELNAVGKPEMPVGLLRGSKASELVAAQLNDLESDAAKWALALRANVEEVLLLFRTRDLRVAVGDLVEHSMLEVIAQGGKRLEGLVASVRAGMTEERAESGKARLREEERVALAQACDKAFRQLEIVGAHVRRSASVHVLTGEIKHFIEQVPERATLVVQATPLSKARRARDVRMGEVFPKSHASALLFESLLPALDTRVREVVALLAATSSVLRQCVDIAALARNGNESVDDQDASAREALVRALNRLDEHMHELRTSIERNVGAGRENVRDILSKIDTYASVAGPAATRWQNLRLRGKNLARSTTTEWIARFRKQAAGIRHALERLTGSQLGKDARLRVGSGTLDAASIREYTQRLVRNRKIPPDYARLFSAEPVREHRFFLVHHAELQEVVAAENAWLSGGPNSVLIYGSSGSGRTSLLNLCELELSSPRVLRPEPLGLRRDVGVIMALANELGVAARKLALATHFHDGKAVVLIDDIEEWFTPNLNGVRDMTALLDLVVETRLSVFWVFSVQRHTLALLDEVLPLRRVIGRRIGLPPLSGEDLRRVVESRHRMSGRPLFYQRSRAASFWQRLRPGRDESVYYRVLSRVSLGNLGRAFEAWQRSVTLESDGSIRPHMPNLLNLSLPLTRQLPPSTLAILLQLLRFGPFAERSFCDLMMLRTDEMRRELHFLRDAGLLFDSVDAPDMVQIPPQLRPFLVEMLEEGGVAT
jgi:Kef-type K+ transport system membrane component KefB